MGVVQCAFGKGWMHGCSGLMYVCVCARTVGLQKTGLDSDFPLRSLFLGEKVAQSVGRQAEKEG